MMGEAYISANSKKVGSVKLKISNFFVSQHVGDCGYKKHGLQLVNL